MIRTLTIGLLGFLAATTLGLGGCGGGVNVVQPGVALKPNDTLRDPATRQFPPMRAHVIGVNADGMKKWESQNVTEHFMRSREQAAEWHAREFSLESGEIRLTPSDPAWSLWKKPMYLIVLVDLPGKGAEGGKPNDPRRHVISLNSNRWSKLEGDIVVKVTPDGLVRETPENPVEPTEF